MIIKGQKINDRYQIIRTIGEGGMANVYLAHDVILDRDVAVKVLRGDLADDEKFVRRFQREAISASSLNHPNIVEMYDVGEDDGKYYIVMEFIDGKTLKSLVKKRGYLTVPEVIDIMLQLTSAIACAHDSYIIHRDIKPQNVLILDDGTVKITDFGIAMALNSNELTQTNSVMGSVHYLPPEQANGSGSTIKSDIYSLGILMYELLVGKVPFKGDNAVEIAIKQMKEPIPSVCKQMPGIPQSIENIILKCCAKNPKNRYDNVREMYDDIKNCMEEENINQQRVTYQYAEQDLEETKVMPKIEPVKKIEKKPINKNKRDKWLWITGGICAALIAIMCLVIIIYPAVSKTEEIEIPDVSNLTVVEAERILQEKGLIVNTEVQEMKDNDIVEGNVIKTNPQAKRTVKKKTRITLIVSSGSDAIIIEDYKGQNYKTVQANLENLGLIVSVEPETIAKENQNKYKENTVINQSAEANTKLTPGDSIIIYYARFSNEYPKFAEELWTITEIQEFCDKNNVTLRINYQDTNDYPDGTIISQSRYGEVISGATLTITVSREITNNDLGVD